MALLTYSQQQAIKPISANNQSKFAQMETEVENSKFRDLLGLPLLQDLQNNPDSTENKLLLEGDTFVNCQGFEVKHKGLYYVLAFLVYEKYVGESFVADTFTGMVQKVRQDSEQLHEGSIKRLQNNAMAIALSEFELIKEYLISKNNEFFCFCKKRSVTTPTFGSVRKTNERNSNGTDYVNQSLRRFLND